MTQRAEPEPTIVSLSQHRASWVARGGRGDHNGDAAAVMALVAATEDIPLRRLLNQDRCDSRTARARQLAMYLTHVVLGRQMLEVGQLFGRDRTTVSHACAIIEDRRDDAAFDRQVSVLEHIILGWADAGDELMEEARHAAG